MTHGNPAAAILPEGHMAASFDVRSTLAECSSQFTCRDAACATLVAEQGGRWFIRMGHPGFNLPANNWKGYATEAAARAAVRRVLSR